MTEPVESPVSDEALERPADQSWLEMENVRGGEQPSRTRDTAEHPEPERSVSE